jgi:ABC-type phosphate transport system substrate-binding protein
MTALFRTGRHRSARRRLTLCLAGVLAAATVSLVTAAAPSPVGRATAAGAASVCAPDGASGCLVTLPCATQTCPTVDVAPTTGIENGQFVSISSKNFPSGDSMRVAVCSDTSPAADPSCLTGNWEEQNWTPIHVPITVNAAEQNLTQVSYPAFLDPSGQGNPALPAHDLTNTEGVVPGFYCDATDPCDMVITEEPGVGNATGNGPPVSSSNSAVVPLTFASQSNGCPSTDPIVYSNSTYSLEHFMTSGVEATCAESGGVIDLNTATDNQSVGSAFASGGADIGFTDSPAYTSAQADLQGKKFAYIPIAVSASAVAYLAGVESGGVQYPLSSYNMTPNMVAGLITSLYQSPQGTVVGGQTPKIILADNIASALDCNKLLGCKSTNLSQELTNELKYDAFDLLNPVSPGVVAPTQFGSFMSNVSSGSSYQVSNWICSAPNTPYTVQVDLKKLQAGQTNPVTETVTDPNLAPTTLTSAPIGSTIWPPYQGATWVFPTCQPYATFPALSATSSDFSEGSSPAFQAKSIRGYAYAGGPLPVFGTTYAGFGVMDSSEASFYGLNVANLQNAAGNFVAPTPSSLTAAMADITPCAPAGPGCPAGTYQVSYTNPDPAAYPLPDITYAMVPTTPIPAAKATAIKDLLTNLVTYSHGDGKNPLPAGYAPLPDAEYQTALAAINADIVAAPPSATPATPPSGGGPPSTSGGSGGTAGPTVTSPEIGMSPTAATSTLSASSTSVTSRHSGHAGAGKKGGAPRRTVPTGIILVSVDAAARYLLPALVLLGLACLIVGPLLLWAQARRRRPSAGGTP